MYKIISYRIWVLTSMALLVLSGCTGLRKLPEGEYLFTGAQIHYDSVSLLSNPAEANSQFAGLIKSTNAKILWMRPFLSIHNMVKEPEKEKGVRYWIKYKLGKPPVKLSDLNLDHINDALINRLENLGHFHAQSAYEVKKGRKTATVDFGVQLRPHYKFDRIGFPKGNSPLESEIFNSGPSTLVQTGKPYSLKILKDERARIDRFLKNRGYFYFSPNYLLFVADSAGGTRRINLDLKIKPETPVISRTAFSLDKIFVHDDFSLSDYAPDTVSIAGYHYISNNHFFNPKTIIDAVFLNPDSIYSRQDHYNTLSYLMGLGVYKYANARFTVRDTLKGKMDVGIYLTPIKKMSLGAEISGAIKSNNYAGPGLNLSFRNRNTFRGAELFSLTLGGRFETQYSGSFKGETSYEITLNGALTFPRFVPFRFNRNQSREYVPKTTIDIGGGLFSRIRFYQFQSFNVTLGYGWQSSDRFSQTFSPVDISFTHLVNSSDEFQDYLNNNPTIKRSFEQQFILGSGYNFTYSTLHLKNNPVNFMVSQGIELSGNLANLVTTVALGEKPTPESQHKILDVAYSQYVRLRNEMRFFWGIGKKSRIGWRTIIAAAIPYGNSATIPYVKQFFVGGTNSVRAFRARTVGPGSYALSDTLTKMFMDQSGDIKLEASLEYRFPIIGYFKGAVFADAGNVWLFNDDPQRPGGQFEAGSFYRDIAVGSGLGLRIDFTFVVVRLDVAFPLRKPSFEEGQRWVIDKIQLGNPSWRKENLVLNIAIGYPF